MPKRSNEFQKLVFLVKQQIADDAEVSESKLLTDIQTGTKREVDICIQKSIAGHQTTISIECINHKRKADVQWVEQMKSKHDRLSTNVLVLVSKTGFTKEAKDVASKCNIETLALEEINDKSIQNFVENLNSIWAKMVFLKPNKVVVCVLKEKNLETENVIMLPDNLIFNNKGEAIYVIKDLILSGLNSEEVLNTILRDGIKEHKSFVVRWNIPLDNLGDCLFLRKDNPSILRAIEFIEVTGECLFDTDEFSLQHNLLGNTKVSWGIVNLMNEESLFVATEDEKGRKKASINPKNVFK